MDDVWFAPEERQAIIHDRYDMKIADKAAMSSGLYGECLERNSEKLKTFPELLKDGFFTLYKYLCELNEEEGIDPKYRLNRRLVDEAMKTGDYRILRKNTRHDELASAVGATVLAEEMVKNIDEKTLDQLNKAIGEIERNQEKHGDKKEGEAAGDLEAKGAEALAEAVNALGESLDMAGGAISQSARLSTKKAAGEVERAVELIRAWGLDRGGETKLPIDEALALLRRIRDSEKLLKLGEAIGREKRRAVTAQRLKPRREAAEIYDIELGRDIERVLPSELALMDDESGLDFDRRFVEGALLQYRISETEGKERGPMVVCVDTSYSMVTEVPEREIAAKAFAMGLCEIAVREKREFTGILFGSRGEMRVFEKLNDPRRAADFAEFAFNGGTCFDEALTKAADIVERQQKNADVVFITDGQCDVSKDVMSRIGRAKEVCGMRIYGVLVDRGWGGEVLSGFSDEIVLAGSFSSKAGTYTETVYRAV